MRSPTAIPTPMTISVGSWNEWLTRKRPIRVLPVSSKLTVET